MRGQGVGVAAALLLLGAAHNNAHKLVEWDLRGHVFTTTGHILLTAEIVWMAYVYRHSAPVLLVSALVGAWTAQVAACNVLWLTHGPWPVEPGGELCSDGLRFPLGTLGCMAALLVAAHLYRLRKDAA